MAPPNTIQELKDIANKLRIDSIRATSASKSGHPTSCCSAAEIMSVLFFDVMRYKVKEPRDPSSDRFVMSKGHAAPILYAAWAEAGLFPPSELLNLRKIDCDLEGHPTPTLPFVDVATGSLGQGLSCAAGMAYTGKHFDKASYRVYCLMCCVENEEDWHGKPLGNKTDEAIAAIEARIVNKGANAIVPQPPPVDDAAPIDPDAKIMLSQPPNYELGQLVATREAYGIGLVKLGKGNSRVIALDGDVKNSTFSIKFRNQMGERFIECYIAEQNLVGVAIGCGTRGRTVPYVSTFAAFFARAYDQIRMGAISQTNVNFCGSHVGCSIGEDGPSQMALEDMAMFRAIPGATVFYPSDGVSTERAVELSANLRGVCFIRSSRPANPVIYSNNETFKPGQAKVVRKSDSDAVTVIGAGVTLHEAMKAADTLAARGINIRIVDPFTVKPLDAATILACARETGGKILTVEDHYPEGGLGEAVCSAMSDEMDVRVRKLCVPRIPRSGPPAVLLDMFGISAKCIVTAVDNFK
ncbi:PREDICTED: transketolase-like [Priapulus caudatus]|uniref:transketolase n=1 Tax=Priapulus caudatus TaxID=37621 RepID=A0ABM1ELW8_PRICU|nr:PREDICTED: transketolase-like [Priapulus caudatus]